MYTVTETSTQQAFAVVGSSYVSEHHSDETHRYLPAFEKTSLVDFEELLTKLRTALSVRSR